MSADIDAPQSTCAWCNHVVTPVDKVCPGCGNRNPVYSARAHHAAEAAQRRAARRESAGGEARSPEGTKSVLGEGCMEGCVEVVGGMLFGMVALLAVVTAIARRQSGR